MSFIAGKVALVTGGASGMGFAIAKSLLEQDAKGVAILDIDVKTGEQALSILKRDFPDKVIFIKTDVTSQKQFEDAFEATVNRFKNLDIVVNVAGTVDEENWEFLVALNLGGVIRGTKLALEKYFPKYKSSNEGVVVNIASTYGIEVSTDFLIYTTTKHGVVGFGRTLDLEGFYEKYKARILTVCPGAIDTPLYRRELVRRGGKEAAFVGTVSPPEYISENVMKLLNSNERGVWVMEDLLTPYKVQFPSRKDMQVPE